MSHVCDGGDPRCASCQALARRLGTVRRAMTSDDAVDDLQRARIWAQLEDRLADPAPPRRSRAIAYAAATASAAAIIGIAAVAALRSPRPEPRTLTVPAGTVVASRLGPHTSASIVGPAELELGASAGDAVAVRLHRGTLLAAFEGGPGRSLRVETPSAVVEVVGTQFAVEVDHGTTCTSVLHGRVRVATAAGAVLVSAGERSCTGAPSIEPIRDDVRTALAHLVEPTVAVGPAAEPPSAPTVTTAPASATGEQRKPPSAQTVTTAPDSGRSAAPRLDPSSGAVVATAPASGRSAAPRLDPSTTTVTPSPRPAAAPPSHAAHTASLTPPTAAPSTERRPQLAQAPITGDAAPMPPTPKVTADELYRAAEAELAAHDPAAADRALAALVAAYPDSPLIDQALYDRARIAYEQRAWPAARRQLDQLAAIPGTPLAEPGRYLRCRIATETHEATAAACLSGFRAAYPRSPHDPDALALLVELAHARAGCPGAAALVEELLQRYPGTAVAAAWRTRCPEQRSGER